MTRQDISALVPPMITIPGGTFRMGTPDAKRSDLARRYGGTRESYAEEAPEHEVAVATFVIAATPVTNRLWAAFAAATGGHWPITWAGSFPEALADHPVVDVRWHDAQAFCAWLAAQTGRGFRLPTEAEWEKAARGSDGRVFPWGDTFEATRCNTRESQLGLTTPAGHYPAGASPYGVLDMAGNVWEWTQSLQAPYPYDPDDGRNGSAARIEGRTPGWLQRLRGATEHARPPIETRRIIRGGCFANPEGFARSACRLRLEPQRRTPFLGIRLASDG